MTAFFATYGATIFVCAVILLIVGGIVAWMIRNRKRKGSFTGGCSCGCQNCAMSEYCHEEKNPKTK